MAVFDPQELERGRSVDPAGTSAPPTGALASETAVAEPAVAPRTAEDIQPPQPFQAKRVPEAAPTAGDENDFWTIAVIAAITSLFVAPTVVRQGLNNYTALIIAGLLAMAVLASAARERLVDLSIHHARTRPAAGEQVDRHDFWTIVAIVAVTALFVAPAVVRQGLNGYAALIVAGLLAMAALASMSRRHVHITVKLTSEGEG